MLILLVAADEQNIIGKQHGYKGMPWHHSEELAYFRKTTLHQHILMGKRTFQAIGAPLPQRHTIVVSQSGFYHPSIEAAASLTDVLQRYRKTGKDLYICGGASVYAQAMPYVDEIRLSRIPGSHSGDVYFPPIPSSFRLQAVVPFATFTLEIYRQDQ